MVVVVMMLLLLTLLPARVVHAHWHPRCCQKGLQPQCRLYTSVKVAATLATVTKKMVAAAIFQDGRGIQRACPR